MDKLQLISIQIMNSKYRILFTLAIYGIIYCFLCYDKVIAFCMDEQNIPSIAEAKPTRSMTRSIIQREVSAFAGLTETLDECIQTIIKQEKIIEQQNETIKELHGINEESNKQISILRRQLNHKDVQQKTLLMHTEKLQKELARFNQQSKNAIQEYNEFLRILAEEQAKSSQKK